MEARFINSVQMGSADLAPSRLSSRLSSKPTQTTQRRSEVKPAHQPSREVPVLPAAGRRKPRERTEEREDGAEPLGAVYLTRQEVELDLVGAEEVTGEAHPADGEVQAR